MHYIKKVNLRNYWVCNARASDRTKILELCNGFLVTDVLHSQFVTIIGETNMGVFFY